MGTEMNKCWMEWGSKCARRRADSCPMSEFLGVPNNYYLRRRPQKIGLPTINEIRIPELFKLCATRT